MCEILRYARAARGCLCGFLFLALAPMTTHPLLLHDLKRVFGYDTFRPLQREIMEASLDGRDVLAILPTGAGKSLCYQLPALARRGLTVVASPLIALMKDQVDQMQAAGVAATFLNSTLDGAQLRKRELKLERGEYQILYVAPERLVSRDFLAQLAGWNVEAFAVDEAHCISEWEGAHWTGKPRSQFCRRDVERIGQASQDHNSVGEMWLPSIGSFGGG